MRISCLTVTLPVPGRAAMLDRAIDAYLRQGYANRELVLVVDHGAERAAVAARVAALGRDDIRIVMPDRALTLGALRNLSVAAARGDLLCQWDDDDLHHPDRLAAQRAALDASGAAATILADVMLYRAAERVLRWTNWARTPVGGHPATLLCRRAAAPLYPETGPAARRGEDLAALLPLAEAGALATQADAPHLYCYVTHAGNVSGAAHHDLLARTLAVSAGRLRRREDALRRGLAAHGFGEPVRVMGGDAVAFMLEGCGSSPR